MSENPVTNISVTYNTALVTVDNLPNDTMLISQLFGAIAGKNINIDMIQFAVRGNISISFSLPSADLVNGPVHNVKKKAKVFA